MRPLSFSARDGLAAIAALAVGVALALVAVFGAADLRHSLADLGGPLPLSTRIAVSSAWLFGAPVVLVSTLISACVFLAHRPKARFVACLTLACVGLFALAFTHWALKQPLVEIGELLRP